MKHIVYTTKNTCSKVIEFDLTDQQKISNLKFQGGCNGNLSAISKLLEGQDAKQTASILSGNTCQARPTSCCDQLSQAIMEAINE
jgi:uncharacterized protein (TIGR03905 family)